MGDPTLRHLELFSRHPHGEHRAGGLADDLFRGASEEHVVYPGSAMGPDDALGKILGERKYITM